MCIRDSCLTLLDERGAEYRSVELAGWLQKRMLGGTRRLVLAVGGPYGFSDAMYALSLIHISWCASAYRAAA